MKTIRIIKKNGAKKVEKARAKVPVRKPKSEEQAKRALVLTITGWVNDFRKERRQSGSVAESFTTQ